MKHWPFILVGLLLLGLLAHSIYRDAELGSQFPVDLRNRVVGARLQKDGKIPYFYHPGPDTATAQLSHRYLDIYNPYMKAEDPSNITASPFFHQLLYPICDLPQRTISSAWIWFEYLLLALMVWMMCTLAGNSVGKMLFVSVAVMFTCTEAWKSLIQTGQIYFLIAFLISCIITGILHKKPTGILLAAVCAVMLVLIRPISIVVFIPMVFNFKTFRLFLVATGSGLLLYGILVLNTEFDKNLWREYARAVQAHIQYHQQVDDSVKSKEEVRKIEEERNMEFRAFPTIEGYNYATAQKHITEHPIPVYSENGNFFVLYRHLTHKKISVELLNVLSLSILLLLSGLFCFFLKKHQLAEGQSLLFGFLLFMLVGFFSPIYMHQYYTVQWLPILLTGYILIGNWNSLVFFLLTLGLFLNIITPSWIPMRHTLGELAWYAGLFIICFSKNVNDIPWRQPL